MRASWRVGEAVATLDLRLDPDDRAVSSGQEGARVRLAGTESRFEAEIGGTVHPDLFALLTLALAGPFIASRLDLDRGVSPEFADEVANALGFAVRPVDRSTSPRSSGGTIGISFGGGTDSTAAALALPANSPLIHLRRLSSRRVPNLHTRYRADVLEAVVKQFSGFGRQVHIGYSDCEFLVAAPHPTLASWPGIAAISILLADRLDLGGIAVGAVLGSAYMPNGRFREIPAGEAWRRLFDAVGLTLIRPVAGLTEVSTSRIVAASPYRGMTRSCTFGGPDAPCFSCMKCLRKELVVAAAAGREPDRRLLRNLTADHPVTRELVAGTAIPGLNVIEYLLNRVDLRGHPLEAAVERLRHPREDTEWVGRHFYPAIPENVPKRLRRDVTDAIHSVVEPMTPGDLELVRSWDSTSRFGPSADR
ncbi:MAG: DUF6395 domain-containing protein [Acidimicrobiia bacterium]|nr:MAG: DUF6395 domain-containing protein [Acidimicrobiia bacterium]